MSVDGVTELTDPGEAADEEQRPQQGNRFRDPKDRFVTTDAAARLDDVHLAHDFGLGQSRGEPLPPRSVGSIGKRQPVQPIEPMQASHCSPAHRAAAVEQNSHRFNCTVRASGFSVLGSCSGSGSKPCRQQRCRDHARGVGDALAGDIESSAMVD